MGWRWGTDHVEPCRPFSFQVFLLGGKWGDSEVLRADEAVIRLRFKGSLCFDRGENKLQGRRETILFLKHGSSFSTSVVATWPGNVSSACKRQLYTAAPPTRQRAAALRKRLQDTAVPSLTTSFKSSFLLVGVAGMSPNGCLHLSYFFRQTLAPANRREIGRAHV